jgi:hypothetical protein
MLDFNKKSKAFRTVISIISVLFLISFVTITAVSCAEDIKGPGPSKTPGPGEDFNPGPGEIDAGLDDLDLIAIEGSGNTTTTAVDVKDYNRIEVSREGILIIEQGDTEGLVIETDDNLMDYIKVSVSDKKLKIENIVDEGYDLVPTEAIYYYLKLKELKELKLPGVVTVKCSSLQVSSLNLDMSGVTDVELAGKADILNMSVDGPGDLKGSDFLTTGCSISGTGTADIVISVSEKLDIDFKGIGSIKYIGDPEVTKDVGKLVDVEKID